MKILLSDNYKICCLKPDGVKCSTNPPWYKSCDNLLASLSLKLSFCCLSAMIITGNIFSIIFQRKCTKMGPFETMIISTNLVDLLCGIHLTTIWSADLIFRKNFVLTEIDWRSSLTCFFSFGASFLFSILSPILLCLMSFSRLMVIKYPLETKFKQKKILLKIIIFFTSLTFIISSVFTLVMWVSYSSIPLGLCSPFVDPTNKVTLIKVDTIFTIFVQYGAVFFISYTYVKLVMELKKSGPNLQKSKKKTNLALIIQLVVLTSSNIICWVPSGIIFLTSMFMEKYPIEIVIWTTVCGTTLNSVINPVVFLVTNFRLYRHLKNTKR